MPFQKGNKLSKGRPPGSTNRFKSLDVLAICESRGFNPVHVLIDQARECEREPSFENRALLIKICCELNKYLCAPVKAKEETSPLAAEQLEQLPDEKLLEIAHKALNDIKEKISK